MVNKPDSREVFRPQRLVENIVMIDGMSWTGKGLILPLLSSLDNVDLWLNNCHYEYFIIMHGLGKIENDAAATLLNLYADQDFYNLQVGRHVNYRKTDLSSVQYNLLDNVMSERQANPDGDKIVEKIKKEKNILPLMTHFTLGISDLPFLTFDERLKLYIVTVRHPLFLIESWFERGFSERLGSDLREFTLTVKVNGNIVPWFASDWADEYAKLNTFEQAIATVNHIITTAKKTFKDLSKKNKNKVLFIPFEKNTVNPNYYIDEICSRLNANRTNKTELLMKQTNVPREPSMDYIENNRNIMEKSIKSNSVSVEYADIFRKLCSDYESEYLKDIL
jgi:hypothetical protein